MSCILIQEVIKYKLNSVPYNLSHGHFVGFVLQFRAVSRKVGLDGF